LSAKTMPHLAKIVQAVADARHAPKLIVLDTLSQGFTDDENESKAVAPVMRGLAALRNQIGCAIMGVHHLVKLDQQGRQIVVEPTLDMIRGSGAITRNIDTVLAAWADKDRRFWRGLKQKDGTLHPKVAFELRVLPTGRTNSRGRPETSCIIIPAAPEQKLDPAVEEQVAEMQASHALQQLVEKVVEVVRVNPNSSGNGIVERMRPVKRLSALAAIERAEQSGRIRNAGTTRKARYVVPA